MDDYPEHLAPEFEPNGAVATPFEDWWEKAKLHFVAVPEEVARYWLHEHWSHSPYSFLKSADYVFERVSWPSRQLFEVKTNWNDFSEDKEKCLWRGRRIVDEWPDDRPYRTTAYMLKHGGFPTPIIVLDNRDAHINEHNARSRHEVLPAGYILVEGHRRFDMALYLIATDRFKAEVDIWLMKRKQSSK